jgi:hypothetical protein
LKEGHSSELERQKRQNAFVPPLSFFLVSRSPPPTHTLFFPPTPTQTYRHEQGAEEQHKHKVRRAPAEAILLEEAAVPHEKVHVKDELERELSKEEKVGQQAPHLAVAENEVKVVVEGERRHEVQRAGGRRDERRREVRPRDDGDVKIPLQGIVHGGNAAEDAPNCTRDCPAAALAKRSETERMN